MYQSNKAIDSYAFHWQFNGPPIDLLSPISELNEAIYIQWKKKETFVCTVFVCVCWSHSMHT